jgi:hypothetical protein
VGPSRSIKLFGTEEPVGELVPLRAGPLRASLDAGNLRYITIGGREALRAIAFLVRDRNWGTYSPTITNLTVNQGAESFTVGYDAVCSDADQSFGYRARIEGRADGSLSFEADGEALSDFVTNRTGFVVLHPLEGVVGRPVSVEHTDGTVVESSFPELIDPACPFHDIRALTHEIAPGAKLECRMEGDAFEMEDHRNWMDASYKTYVRPLALPWPYRFANGERTRQRVAMTLHGRPPAVPASGDAEITVAVGGPTGHAMPRIGLAAPAEHLDAALREADLLKAAGVGFLVCHFDPRKGHDAAVLRAHGTLAASLGAEPVLEAVVPCLDAEGRPSADPSILRRDMAAIRDAAAGVSFPRVAVTTASDLKSTLPGSAFPPGPSWEALIAAAREAFASAEVGGGMFSYFTELNRKRPPSGLLDFVCHTGVPLVHAGDDTSFLETLEALPSIFASVRAFAGGAPYWIFPTAISMRDNPYGAAPAENPRNIRQAMNRIDPRERGLIGAAWYAGYLARAAHAGVDAVAVGAVAGPSGIVYTRQEHEQPWFDRADAKVYPHYHVIAGHAALQGGAVHEVSISAPGAAQALAVSLPEGFRLWLTNLTGSPRTLHVTGIPTIWDVLTIDEASFEPACRDVGWLTAASRVRVDSGRITLAAYAVAELRGARS